MAFEAQFCQIKRELAEYARKELAHWARNDEPPAVEVENWIKVTEATGPTWYPKELYDVWLMSNARALGLN